MNQPVLEHPSSFERRGAPVLGTFIDTLTYDRAVSIISKWASRKESRYVCICNVHSVVTAKNDHEIRKVIREADIATPDGMPIAWMLRAFGFLGQETDKWSGSALEVMRHTTTK